MRKLMYYESYSEPYKTLLPKRFKKWKCIWCGESILSAEEHYHYAGYWEGKKQNWRMHKECFNAFGEKTCGEGGLIIKWVHQRGSTEESLDG